MHQAYVDFRCLLLSFDFMMRRQVGFSSTYFSMKVLYVQASLPSGTVGYCLNFIDSDSDSAN